MHRSVLAFVVLQLAFAVGCAASALDHDSDHAALEAEPGSRVCSSLIIGTRAQLEAARVCRVVDGDLRIEGPELTMIAPADLPHLELVTGSLIVAHAPRITRVSLTGLIAVGGSGQDDLLQFGFDLPALQRIELPALSDVHGDFAIAALEGLRALAIDALVAVDGRLVLSGLPALEALAARPSLQLGGGATLERLCRMAPDALPQLNVTASADTRMRDVGCCSAAAVACEPAACDCAR